MAKVTYDKPNSGQVSCVHHETSCWPPSMSYVAPVSAVLLMM